MSLSSWYTREVDADIAPIVSVPSEAAWHMTPRRLRQEPAVERRSTKRSSDPLAVDDSLGLSEEQADTDADTSPLLSLISDLGHQVADAIN